MFENKTVVIKFGTSVLTQGSNLLSKSHMLDFVRQIKKLIDNKFNIIIVSSGAIAAGREHLNFPTLSNKIAYKQMLASVGQSQLMSEWAKYFSIYDLNIGQMLLTRADLEDRKRYLNAKDLLDELIANDIIPIINENDAVATTEIKVGDNDNLSASVAVLANANKLLMLTDQSGLFEENPTKNPNAKLIRSVPKIDHTTYAISQGSSTKLGTGGMFTKIQAAEVACLSGIEVQIASGFEENIILDTVLRKKNLGTTFEPSTLPIEKRKSWILSGPISSGDIFLDEGANSAILNNGKSLLSKGIISVKGTFERGDVVTLFFKNQQIAKGITRYSSLDVKKIMQKHSSEIKNILTYNYGSEVIHRDDLVITNK